MPAWLTLVRADKKTNRKKCGAGVTTTKRKTNRRLRSCCCGQLANLALRVLRIVTNQRENNDGEMCPKPNCCTREPKVASQRQGISPHRRRVPRPGAGRIRTADKIDKAHVSYWLFFAANPSSPAAPFVMRSGCTSRRPAFFVRVRLVTNSGNAAFIWTSCDTSNRRPQARPELAKFPEHVLVAMRAVGARTCRWTAVVWSP